MPPADPTRPSRLLLQESDGDSDGFYWEQAFCAASWRRVLPGATVRATVDGDGARLLGARDDRRRLVASPAREVELVLDEDACEWYWFEGAELGTVRWTVEAVVRAPSVTVVMPTFRRERDATTQARRFDRMDCVARVLVIDQGATLQDDARFTRLARSSSKVELITQPNLGGSGGYARGMLESRRREQDAVLLSDDDAVISEEALRRMLTYQALATRPTIVGTGMLSAERPTRLVSHAEAVRPRAFWWTAADGMKGTVDLADTTPEEWGFLRLRRPANYTGWWGTLLPPGTVAELGLSAPYFLKWDDAEYGMRAARHGYDIVVLPGASVHHPTWGARATQMTWTARVLHRNRLATAAAYGAPRGVITSSFAHQVKHILSGHHLTAALWAAGIDAFSAGPDGWLGRDLAHARAEGQRIVDTFEREHAALTAALTATRTTPLHPVSATLRAIAGVLRPRRSPRLVLSLRPKKVTWRATMGADAVLMATRKGRAVGAFAVDGRRSRALLRRTARQHLLLALRWRSLGRRYRRALGPSTTVDAWQPIFAAHLPEREVTPTRESAHAAS